jgi:lycopene cyclase domain-containing protein
MASCLVLTLPLEIVVGARVYRQPRRLLAVLGPVAAVYLLWDAIAIHRDHWGFAPEYTTGVLLPGRIPIEELVFLVVIPICALLTFEAVGLLWPRSVRREGDRA